jgi:hypothetical protein
LEWRKEVKYHTLQPVSKKFLEEGRFYFGGHDKQLRPILVMNAHLINLKDVNLSFIKIKFTNDDLLSGVCTLLDIVKKYVFVDGKIENWVIIIETNELGLWSFPYKVFN